MRPLRDDEEEDERVIRDRQRMRVPLQLMDGRGNPLPLPSVLHRPGPVAVADAANNRRVYTEYDTRVANAWRGADPPRVEDRAPAPPPAASPPAQRVADHYARYDARVQQAWRSPPPVEGGAP
jgi:hypothetical protein